MTRKTINVAPATGVVMMATFASAVLAILREVLVAARLGANLEMDAYFFAFAFIVRLPEFMLSAIAASLVPVYIHRKEKGHTALFTSTVINLYMLLLLGATALAVTTARFAVSALASGFDTPGQQLVSRLIWILSPTIVLTGLWGMLKTLLNAEELFFVSTISTAFLSAGVIGAVILVSPQLGVYSLPLGVLVASVCQVIWTAYWLWRKGFRYGFMLDLNDPGLRRFLALLWPCVVGAALGYPIAIIDRSMASHLPEGTISALSYAERPMSILTRIVIFSFITVLLPSLSQQSIDSDQESFKESVTQTLVILMFVTMPLSLVLAALRMPLNQLLFQRGRFDAVATTNTANVFGGYALGLTPMAIAITLSTVFNALEDTKTPAFFGAGSNLISKIVFNLVLIAAFGAMGIALATSLMYVVSGTLLLFILRRRLQGIGGKRLLKTFSRILIASLLAVSPVYLIANHSDMPPVVVIIMGVIVGSTLYALFSALLRIPELLSVYGYLLKLKNHRIFANFSRQA